jgi:thiazole synthase
MPLASPIGSGLGMLNQYAIRTIKRRLSVPVIVDAGVGTASDACVVMEQGVDGILMNTGIAGATDPVRMATAMRRLLKPDDSHFLLAECPGGRSRFPLRP